MRKRIKDSGGSVGKIYGQEKNITTYNLARMNMLLHGMKDTEFEIFHGDTLENSWSLLNEMNPSKKTEFDAIVANPPFSLRWEPNDTLAEELENKLEYFRNNIGKIQNQQQILLFYYSEFSFYPKRELWLLFYLTVFYFVVVQKQG